MKVSQLLRDKKYQPILIFAIFALATIGTIGAVSVKNVKMTVQIQHLITNEQPLILTLTTYTQGQTPDTSYCEIHSLGRPLTLHLTCQNTTAQLSPLFGRLVLNVHIWNLGGALSFNQVRQIIFDGNNLTTANIVLDPHFTNYGCSILAQYETKGVATTKAVYLGISGQEG
jgi:hypothetical protein